MKKDTILTHKIFIGRFGHVWRADGKTIKLVTEGKIIGERLQGKPRTRRKDVVKKCLEIIHENV